MDVAERRRAADALRAIKRGGEGWYSLSDAVLGRPAPRDEVVARLADLIDPGEDVSVSAYDLLSDEDREALWWVHSFDGGLDAVSGRYREADYRRIELCSTLGIDTETGWSDAMAEMTRRLMPDSCEMEGAVGAMIEYHRVLNGVCKRLGLTDGTGQPEQDGVIYEAVERRLIPEGMEWPRFDGGEQVEIGDETDRLRVDEVRFGIRRGGGCTLLQVSPDGITERLQELSPGERVKRPAAPAADGEPLEVGQTVWPVEGGGPLYVYRVDVGGQRVTTRPFGLTTALDEMEFEPSQLTHTKPEPSDSWERIEEDARGLDSGVDRELFTHTHEDIVRRCKALAGVSE